MRSTEIILFDVQTTGFAKDDEIVQIAAYSGDSLFSVYITPSRPFHRKASEVNGLQLSNGTLTLHGKKVHSVPAKTAFKNLMAFLRRFNQDIILVAHNCFGFGMPRILKLADDLGFLNTFRKLVNGFSDSLVILRNILKDQRSGKGSFSMVTLVRDYLPNESTNYLHNAEYDVRMLELLLWHSELNVSKDLIIQSHKSIDQYFHQQEIKKQVAEAKKSLQCFKNILSFWIINKMGRNRIHADLLIQTIQSGGYEGLRKLFSENYYGKPRVTRNRKMIRNVYDTLCKHLNM